MIFDKFDIITLGSATVDVFIASDCEIDKEDIKLKIGSKALIRELRFSTGGGGTNSAVCFSKLGLKTGFVGKLGSDHNSELILEELKKEKVRFVGVRGEGLAGYSIVLGANKGERTILTYKGSNNLLRFEELGKKFKNTRAFYFSSMMEDSFETQKKIAEYAQKKNIMIAYNPSTYQVKKGVESLAPILSRTGILILNEEEAKIISSDKEPLEYLRTLGPKVVCITNGEKGSRIFDGTKYYRAFSNKIKCVESTGAGDAFGSTLVWALISGESIDNAIKMATLNAESVIQHPGAKNGLLSREEIYKRLKTHKVRIIKHN